jgi:Squalene-hopene cyclase C-terminal domain/Prenyltransferase and squalene oxidase repeat
MRLRIIFSSTGAAILSTLLFAGTQRSEQPAPWAPGVRPQPVSESIRRGLDWLVRTQHENGGWSQGEESAGMRSSMMYLRDKPNVADTCMATLALMRAGSTPSQGEHARAIRRALDFLSAELEKSDPMSLYVTSVRDTRVQSKLGPYIDTFLTALVLAESKDKMPDESGNKRIAASLNKVIDKIERNQQADGTWDKRGWAPVLSQSMAAKALNRAAQAGVPVSEEIRAKAEFYARRQFDGKTGRFAEAGSAGVPLYSTAASLGAMQDSENTNQEREREILKQLHDARTEQERQSAQRALAGIAENRKDLADARIVVAKRIGDQRFVQGFGSNGGEEFLSYMSIGESLVSQGGEEWEKWNTHITQNLSRIQNQDGSWTGHHCITGRNFCTAAALLVLTVDRTAAPLGGRIQSRPTANR